MVQSTPKFKKGPITAEVYAATPPNVFCDPGTSGNVGKVAPSAANSVTTLGVSTSAALPAGTDPTSTTPEGFPVLNLSLVDQYTALARREVMKVKAGGTFLYGDHVKTGANGVAVKWVDGTDTPGTRKGQCVDPNGGTNGGYSLIHLNV